MVGISVRYFIPCYGRAIHKYRYFVGSIWYNMETWWLFLRWLRMTSFMIVRYRTTNISYDKYWIIVLHVCCWMWTKRHASQNYFQNEEEYHLDPNGSGFEKRTKLIVHGWSGYIKWHRRLIWFCESKVYHDHICLVTNSCKKNMNRGRCEVETLFCSFFISHNPLDG